ncbi:VQ motif-containing protein 9-like [Bidens hawaiensis]|uniref:VQ motif-containing protein 9-like n=1 Tax=Bidens hawaiensis TaxID=980011 RepID=UPI004049CE01
MDKSCQESSSATNPNPNLESTKDHYLKQIHKLSHSISKPPITKPFKFHPPPPVVVTESPPYNHPSQQPPVYNVSKTDFRDVVQKLTGSPAHDRPVKPQSSRLQRVRPPPLEQVFACQRRNHQPLSPLPPLPAVHAAAESPVSAYMRCFQTSVGGFTQAPPPATAMLSPRFPLLSPTAPAASPRLKSV